MKNNIIRLTSYKMNYQISGAEIAGDLLDTLEANFHNGNKNVAISSTHYYSLQQKFILLALNYFNQQYPQVKIGTVSFSYDSGRLQEFTNHATPTDKDGVYNFGNQFDVISWKYLIENKLEKTISNSYDLLIWELPEIEKLSISAEELKDSLENINALFIISNRLKTDSDNDFVRRIGQYFLNHGVNISNILPMKHEKEENRFTKIMNDISGVFKKSC